MTSISSWDWPTARAWRPAITLAGLSLPMLPDNLAAQGQPVETGSHLPVALWFVGAVILGLALAYGIMRNRRRTIAEKRATEQATKSLYAEEERDRVKSRRGF
jgi:hypothetical protein